MTFLQLLDKLEKEVEGYEPKSQFETLRKEVIIDKLEEEKDYFNLASSDDETL